MYENIKFYIEQDINSELFSAVAEEWAKKISKDGGGKKNKLSQIRKFYDEILNFNNNIKNENDYNLLLPYIKMLNSKAVYAEGRELTTESFTSLIKQCISQLDTSKMETLYILKNFFEAFIGYYRFYEFKSK